MSGVNASFGVNVALTYDVTIPTGANVLMNQPTVVVQSLFVESGASLVGNGGFTVRNELTNQGTLTDLGGTIQGNFSNGGPYAEITGPLAIGGSFMNLGTAAIDSGGSITVAQPFTNNGTILQYGGSINAPGAITNNVSYQLFGGQISNFDNSVTGVLSIVSNSTNPVAISGGTLNNSGAINWSGGAVDVWNSAVINNVKS